MATFFDLSPEQALQILALLPPRDLIAFSATCKQFYNLGRDEELWLPFCLDPIRTHLHHRSDVKVTDLDSSWLRAQKSHLVLGMKQNVPVFHCLYAHLIGPHEWLLGWWVAVGRYTEQLPGEEPYQGALWRMSFRISHKGSGPRATSIIIVGQKAGLELEADVQQMPRHPRVIEHRGSLTISINDGTRLAVSSIRPLRMAFRQQAWHPGMFHDPPLTFEIGVDGTLRAVCGSTQWGMEKERDRHWRPWGVSDDFSLGRTVYCGGSGTEWKHVAQSYNNAPFPSPSLLPIVRDLVLDAEAGGPEMTRLMLSMERINNRWWNHSFIPITSPIDLIVPTSEHRQMRDRHVIEPGVYAASYGPHGFEYLLVSFRELTEEDFDDPRLAWEGSLVPLHHHHPHRIFESTSFEYPSRRDHGQHPDEEPDWSDPSNHLGPFSHVFSCDGRTLRISQDPEHLRVGARVMEATKLTGDDNVPQGQISIRAFLDDPLVDRTALVTHTSRAYNSTPESDQSYRGDGFPWPLVPHPDPSDEELFETPFSPGFGVDLPSTGRVAGPGFTSPSWTNCVVHVEESRVEFSLWWDELGAVSIFRKLSAIPMGA